MRLSPSLFCVPLALFFSASSSAALVVMVGPELTIVNKPVPGTTAKIGLTIYLSASAGTEAVGGYTIPLDLSPPAGIGSPVGMNIDGVTFRTTFPGGPNTPNFTPQEGNLLVIDGANNAQPTVLLAFGTTPTPLFDFNVSIDSSVSEGEYQIDVFRGVLFSLDPNFTSAAIFSPPAIIRVVTVPEPSLIALFCSLIIPVLTRRDRRPRPHRSA